MRMFDLELWARDVIDSVTRHQAAPEDDRVELKSNWIPATKAARRLAAHANTARGEPILWLIGLREDGIFPASEAAPDPADWFAEVCRWFDSEPPLLERHLVVSGYERPVTALLFDTSAIPFLVKNPMGDGSIDREVPWRRGTKTETARREDLLRLLAPVRRTPTIEVLTCEVTPMTGIISKSKADHWSFHLTAYFVPPDPPIYYGRHRMLARLIVPAVEALRSKWISCGTQYDSQMRTVTTLALHAPDVATFVGEFEAPPGMLSDEADLKLEIELNEVTADVPVAIRCALKRAPQELGQKRWALSSR